MNDPEQKHIDESLERQRFNTEDSLARLVRRQIDKINVMQVQLETLILAARDLDRELAGLNEDFRTSAVESAMLRVRAAIRNAEMKL